MSKDALRILIKEIADQAPSISSESVIYCDMDGVLVDFETGTVELLNSILDGDDVKWVTRDGKSIQKALRRLHRELGTEWRAVGRTDLDIKPVRNFMFAVVKDSPGIFYGSLPQLKDGVSQLWPYINASGHQVRLLTAGVKGRPEQLTSEQGKTMWAMENLKPPPAEVIMMPASQKSEYASNDGIANILIDDKPSTIRSWNEMGGIGILHTPGGSSSTIKELRSLGI